MRATVNTGDCLAWLRSMPDNSVDSIITDPPYGLSNFKPARITEAITAWASGDRESVPDGRGFMGKAWDSFVPPPAVWDECLRVLKPGGHLVAFAGSRTHDLMGLSIRMAGFEIRDGLAWLYGSGFPKSLDVSKAIDKDAGHWRGRAGGVVSGNPSMSGGNYTRTDKGAPITPEAQQWEGWGTALKPAFEPVTLARKPLEGTVAANVLKWGTGALNIDGCRVAHRNEADLAESAGKNRHADFGTKAGGNKVYGDYSMVERTNYDGTKGRWPANVVLDEHQAAALDEQSGVSKSSIGKPRGASHGDGWGMTQTGAEYNDMGGASRFFYCAKASRKERPEVDGVSHPTVKPLALMRWLVRLVTPPGGTVLDPFAGSGTTLEAAVLEGFDVTGCEINSAYTQLAQHRIERASNSPSFNI